MVKHTAHSEEGYGPMVPVMTVARLYSFHKASCKLHRALIAKSMRKDRARHSDSEARTRLAWMNPFYLSRCVRR